MKKSILALAVVAASLAGVAQADGTTLYGSMRMAYTYSDHADVGVNGTGGNFDIPDGSNVGNNPYSTSRIGVKGTNDMGNGLTALYKFEWGVNLDNNNAKSGANGSYGQTLTQREAYIGVASDYGTVLAGTVTLPYDDIAAYADIFNGLPGGYLRNLGTDEYGKDFFSPGRTPNVLAYISPNMGGFQATAGVVVNGNNNARFKKDDNGNTVKIMENRDASKGIDAYTVTGGYEANGITAKVGYVAAANQKESNAQQGIDLALGYENDMFGVRTTVETNKNKGSDTKPTAWVLAGHYNISQADKVYASYGLYDYDKDNLDNAQGFGLGYQHKFNKRTRVWAEYGFEDTGLKSATNPNEDADNVNTVSLGLRTDF